MTVRSFDGVDDLIVLGLGSLGFAFGPGTIVAILRKGDDAGTEVLLKAGVSGVTAQYGLEFSGTALRIRCGTTVLGAPTITVTAAEGWVLVAVTKATGSVPPRFHKYAFGTSTWTHENAGSNLGNSGVPATSARLGATNTPSSWFHGDLAIAGVSDTVLSDATIETLISGYAAWGTAGLVANWPLDQASTATAVQDTIGAADETSLTGTSVSSDSVPWVTGSDSATMGVAAAAGIAPTARATASAGSAAATGIPPAAAAAASAGAAAGSGAAPAAAAAAPAGIATAAGVAPTARAAATVGAAAATGITPAAAAAASAGAAAGSGAAPAAAAAAPAGIATAAGVTASSTASETPAPGTATAIGVAPTDETDNTPTPGAANASGIPPAASTLADPGAATGSAITPLPSTIAGVASATGQGIDPTIRTTVTMTLATAEGIAAAAAASLAMGVCVGAGITPTETLSTVIPGAVSAYAAMGPAVTAADHGSATAAIGGSA